MATGQLKILGIETSCDETAASVVSHETEAHGHVKGIIHSDIIYSQIEEHAKFGGVVPELAARAHVERLDGLIDEALIKADCELSDLDGIAATTGPGLIGGLMVGLMSAKALAMVANKPLFGINHLEGHALTARLTHGLAFPYLLLLVSGGHTQLILVKGVGSYERWGTTIDDALGEAFDKTAKLLSLPYPGGPSVEQAALAGDEKRFALPIPMRGHKSFDFSFSGLKTAVRQTATAHQPLSNQDINDMCASFQKSVVATLRERLSRALRAFSERDDLPEKPALVVAGGVAANQKIRTLLDDLCQEYGFEFIAPPMRLCTDNASMIAWAGAERMALGFASDPMDIAPRSRWPLDETAQSKVGSGKRGAKA